METFYSLYPALKHVHFTLIAASVLFLFGRFVFGYKPKSALGKAAPHLVNTLLLLSGITLCFMIKQYPIIDPWLTEKMIAVVAYVLLGIMVLRTDRSLFIRISAFIGALSWLGYAGWLAHFKQVVLLS